MKPPTPDWLDRPGLDQTLDIRYEKVARDEVVATLIVSPRVHQPFGYLHGGASVALAESVASVGASMNCPPGKAAAGVEINASHLRPVADGIIRASARPIRIGHSIQVWEVRIEDEAHQAVCVVRCTLTQVPIQS